MRPAFYHHQLFVLRFGAAHDLIAVAQRAEQAGFAADDHQQRLGQQHFRRWNASQPTATALWEYSVLFAPFGFSPRAVR